ncbi:hypothetical protein B0H12DRAFT_1127104 [Mycena haematopus]|nr:hypothetical protein B0H12DRAFT_1127104 [Mycena haematopus]
MDHGTPATVAGFWSVSARCRQSSLVVTLYTISLVSCTDSPLVTSFRTISQRT